MKQSSGEDGAQRLVLALETSSRTYAVAIGDGKSPRAQAAARRDDPAFPELGELVARTLDRAQATFRDIGTIGVDAGPGGLPSVRAGVAYANGLAFALGVKIFPISSLELMALASRQAYRGPILCLKRAQGEKAYAGLFADDEIADMRYGPRDSIVPAMADGLPRICVAGASRDDVAGLLAGVIVKDSGIAEADVVVLYQAARAAAAYPERLVPVASPLNEASRIFHQPAASRHLLRP
jgi:tRNA threonylcarbamoyl adenosine modification protein YeaZ